MGVRQRAAFVVCLVTVVLVGLALAPAGAQLINLPDDPSTTVPRNRSTTTAAEATSTTVSPSSTTIAPTSTTASASVGGRRSTTTAASSSGRPSPSTTQRRASTTTSAATADAGDEGPTTSGTLRPTTTEVQGGFGSVTTTTADLAMEQASSATGLSTGSVVAIVIAGLLGVALALSALTVHYVRATRPHDHLAA